MLNACESEAYRVGFAAGSCGNLQLEPSVWRPSPRPVVGSLEKRITQILQTVFLLSNNRFCNALQLLRIASRRGTCMICTAKGTTSRGRASCLSVVLIGFPATRPPVLRAIWAGEFEEAPAECGEIHPLTSSPPGV
jgi:hypothetical protein